MTNIKIVAVDSADAISEQMWAALAPAGDPFLNAAFLSILERHGAAGRRQGWQAHHLLAEGEAGKVAGLLPLYFKSNSQGEFVYDWSWAGAYRQLGRSYYPKLFTGLPHTPATGPRLLLADLPERPAVGQALVEAAKAIVSQNDLSSWHVAFPSDADRHFLDRQGLLASHDVQFHWSDPGFGDFDGYLAAFSSEKRRKVKAERRRVRDSGLAIEIRHGHEVEPEEWPALHKLYASTFEKFGNYGAFSASCFRELAAALAGRMVVFVARDRSEPVAVSICFRSSDVLYGRYWGCSGDYPGLHFELCLYQGIDYCLRQGLVRFEPGAGGEHKIARGFVPRIVESRHWIADPAFRGLIGRHLERQRENVQEYRWEACRHLPFRTDAATGNGIAET